MKMYSCNAAVAVALFAISARAWAINKCTSGDGAVTYQEGPCPTARPAVRSDMVEPRKSSPSKPAMTPTDAEFVRRTNAEVAALGKATSELRQRERAELDRICKGKTHERPLVGMSEATVLNCLGTGQPFLTHETQTAASISRQYAYERTTAGVRYLYTRNGIVTAVTR